MYESELKQTHPAHNDSRSFKESNLLSINKSARNQYAACKASR